MRLRQGMGMSLSILMLLLVAGSGLSVGAPAPGPARGTATEVGPAQNAPWFVTGSTTDVVQHASLYVDVGGHFHIAYYDATNDVLKYAVDVGSGGNCGLFGSAQCDEIDGMMQGYNEVGLSMAEDALR